MTIETRSFGSPHHPYQVVTERLTVIDGREYVDCPLHGLIALDHLCAKSPGDHWCREAAHPDYNPEDGDQMTPHDEWERVLSLKVQNWQRTAENAAKALALADAYLDGFVWLQNPEWAELRAIKAASKRAQRRVADLGEHNGLTARQLDRLNAASPAATPDHTTETE
jgi:hypothetical protein